MSVCTKKYNPGFCSDEELIQSFVVRDIYLKLILETLEENTSRSNQHLLVIGSRGMGKTTLVLRVAAEIRTKEEFSPKWYPVLFGEESYEVCSAGQFWLEALFHLYQQTKEQRWLDTYNDLKRNEKDEKRLYERALAQLMDFSDSIGKRLLLVVENLNMILGEQISQEDGWSLRHTLLQEPRVMILATATSRFEEIGNIHHAWYELFKIQELKPLNNAECIRMWESIARKEIASYRIRPIQILTGGNPRLLAILCSFAAKMSFQELMESLTDLVDSHTEYFKSHLDSLPPLERKVFITLLEKWDPVTAREISQDSRIDINKASALLQRLVSKGAVEIMDKSGSKNWYQATERLYNIYYLMRRCGQPSSRVYAIVQFMVNFYEGEELIQITSTLASQCANLPSQIKKDLYQAYLNILENKPDLKQAIIKQTPSVFFCSPDAPSSIKELGNQRVQQLEEEAKRLEEEIDRSDVLIDSLSLVNDILLHQKEEKYEAVEQHLRTIIELYPDFADAWWVLGYVLYKVKKTEEAEHSVLKAIQLNCKKVVPWLILIELRLLQKKDTDAALKTAEQYLEQEKRSGESLNRMAQALWKHGVSNFLEQAESWAQEAVQKKPCSDFQYTLACILATRGKWKEAWESADRFLGDFNFLEKFSQDTIEFFISACSRGQEKEALGILEKSTAAQALEPLVVALKICNGETVRVAQEIYEVATDIVATIENRRKSL